MGGLKHQKNCLTHNPGKNGTLSKNGGIKQKSLWKILLAYAVKSLLQMLQNILVTSGPKY